MIHSQARCHFYEYGLADSVWRELRWDWQATCVTIQRLLEFSSLVRKRLRRASFNSQAQLKRRSLEWAHLRFVGGFRLRQMHKRKEGIKALIDPIKSEMK